MLLTTAILKDLSKGQSTADSIAGRLAIPTAQAETILNRHVTDGNADIHRIGNALNAYRITPKARQELADKAAK